MHDAATHPLYHRLSVPEEGVTFAVLSMFLSISNGLPIVLHDIGVEGKGGHDVIVGPKKSPGNMAGLVNSS